jgi:hypothetical protein
MAMQLFSVGLEFACAVLLIFFLVIGAGKAIDVLAAQGEAGLRVENSSPR